MVNDYTGEEIQIPHEEEFQVVHLAAFLPRIGVCLSSREV